ncbi:uncharacterized protein LOC114318691 [Camellia sinensis]|uniref:uncharacterized protein LOC114318691 n=1 Tax=Camellia sinensis TaxID=4442 RepID=UPI0010364E65|nr:uncharacterized protein LOC114318691 [Camellia sinensis]
MLHEQSGLIVAIIAQPTIIDETKLRQRDDEFLKKMIDEIEVNLKSGHSIENEALKFQNELCVSNIPKLKKRILDEAHKSMFAMHPGNNKILATIYADDIVRLHGILESWEDYLPLAEFAYNNSYHSSIGMASYEALYGRRCRSPVCWIEVRDRVLLGPKIVQTTTEKIKVIQQRLKTAQSKEKNFADVKRRPLEYEVGDRVFIRVIPMKGQSRFGKKGLLVAPHSSANVNPARKNMGLLTN